MKVLVTGHLGYIGRATLNALRENEFTAIGVDRRKIDSNIGVELTSQRAFNLIIRFKPEVIIHLAGQPRDTVCRNNPKQSLRDNVLATMAIIEAARIAKPRRLIFSSSAAVYRASETPYGRQKRLCESLVNKSDIPECIILRYFNVYGFGGHGVIDKWVSNSCPRLTGDGRETRDFIHIHDVVRANILAATRPLSQNRLTLDIGTGIGTNLAALIQIVKPNKLEKDGPLSESYEMSVADTTVAKALLRFESTITLESANLRQKWHSDISKESLY